MATARQRETRAQYKQNLEALKTALLTSLDKEVQETFTKLADAVVKNFEDGIVTYAAAVQQIYESSAFVTVLRCDAAKRLQPNAVLSASAFEDMKIGLVWSLAVLRATPEKNIVLSEHYNRATVIVPEDGPDITQLRKVYGGGTEEQMAQEYLYQTFTPECTAMRVDAPATEVRFKVRYPPPPKPKLRHAAPGAKNTNRADAAASTHREASVDTAEADTDSEPEPAPDLHSTAPSGAYSLEQSDFRRLVECLEPHLQIDIYMPQDIVAKMNAIVACYKLFFGETEEINNLRFLALEYAEPGSQLDKRSLATDFYRLSLEILEQAKASVKADTLLELVAPTLAESSRPMTFDVPEIRDVLVGFDDASVVRSAKAASDLDALSQIQKTDRNYPRLVEHYKDAMYRAMHIILTYRKDESLPETDDNFAAITRMRTLFDIFRTEYHKKFSADYVELCHLYRAFLSQDSSASPPGPSPYHVTTPEYSPIPVPSLVLRQVSPLKNPWLDPQRSDLNASHFLHDIIASQEDMHAIEDGESKHVDAVDPLVSADHGSREAVVGAHGLNPRIYAQVDELLSGVAESPHERLMDKRVVQAYYENMSFLTYIARLLDRDSDMIAMPPKPECLTIDMMTRLMKTVSDIVYEDLGSSEKYLRLLEPFRDTLQLLPDRTSPQLSLTDDDARTRTTSELSVVRRPDDVERERDRVAEILMQFMTIIQEEYKFRHITPRAYLEEMVSSPRTLLAIADDASRMSASTYKDLIKHMIDAVPHASEVGDKMRRIATQWASTSVATEDQMQKLIIDYEKMRVYAYFNRAKFDASNYCDYRNVPTCAHMRADDMLEVLSLLASIIETDMTDYMGQKLDLPNNNNEVGWYVEFIGDAIKEWRTFDVGGKMTAFRMCLLYMCAMYKHRSSRMSRTGADATAPVPARLSDEAAVLPMSPTSSPVTDVEITDDPQCLIPVLPSSSEIHTSYSPADVPSIEDTFKDWMLEHMTCIFNSRKSSISRDLRVLLKMKLRWFRDIRDISNYDTCVQKYREFINLVETHRLRKVAVQDTVANSQAHIDRFPRHGQIIEMSTSPAPTPARTRTPLSLRKRKQVPEYSDSSSKIVHVDLSLETYRKLQKQIQDYADKSEYWPQNLDGLAPINKRAMILSELNQVYTSISNIKEQLEHGTYTFSVRSKLHAEKAKKDIAELCSNVQSYIQSLNEVNLESREGLQTLRNAVNKLSYLRLALLDLSGAMIDVTFGM
jgi:hypothetical protein